MTKYSFFRKSPYLNFLDLINMFLIGVGVSLTSSLILIGLLFIEYSDLFFSKQVFLSNELVQLLIEGKIMMVAYLICFSLMTLALLLYRKSRISKETDAIPFSSIFKKRIDNPIAIFQSIVFSFGCSIIIEPLLNLFPESMSSYSEMSMRFTDVYSIITVVLFAPFLEEVIFRGILLSDIKRSHSTMVAVIISSAVFGIVHLNLIQGFSAVLSGLVFAYVYLATKSLWSAILLHALNNGCSIVMINMYGSKEHLQESTYEVLNNPLLYFLIYGVAICVVLFFLRKLYLLCLQNDQAVILNTNC